MLIPFKWTESRFWYMANLVSRSGFAAQPSEWVRGDNICVMVVFGVQWFGALKMLASHPLIRGTHGRWLLVKCHASIEYSVWIFLDCGQFPEGHADQSKCPRRDGVEAKMRATGKSQSTWNTWSTWLFVPKVLIALKCASAYARGERCLCQSWTAPK